MPNPKRPRRRLMTALAITTTCVVGPAVTIAFGLGGITSFATYMDVHGVIVAMRIAVVAAVAVIGIPLAWAFCLWRLDRIDAKRDHAQLAALRAAAAAPNQSSSPARHRKVA